MSPKELKSLIKTLRSLGVTSYEHEGIKLSLTPEAPVKAIKEKPITEEEEKEIKHKLEELTSIMKLGDRDLIDRMFPDHQPDEESH